MYFLIYASTAATKFTQDDLLALLAQSRETNARLGLTGLLLFSPGSGAEAGTFVQVLEGSPSVVEEMYAKIQRDPRHKDCTVLRQDSWYQRRFADWSMGFRDLSVLKPEEVPGFNPVFLQNWTLTRVLREPDPVLQLLYSFSGV